MGENYMNMFGNRRTTSHVENMWKAQTTASFLDAGGNVEMSAFRSCIENEVILLPLGHASATTPCTPEL